MPGPSGRLTDAAFAGGWAVIRGTPEWIARRQFDAIADAAYLRHGKGVRRLASNLRKVLGDDVSERELRRVTHDGVRLRRKAA